MGTTPCVTASELCIAHSDCWYRATEFVYDAKAEAKLRRKIDFTIVPTVSILYLFCFIDRANIGTVSPS